MKNIRYVKYLKENIELAIAKVFGELLEEQGRVQNPNVEKVSKCKVIFICYFDDMPVAIGAIKPRTVSTFSKANMESVLDEFEWELGYCYTRKEYRNQGVSSNIVRVLLAATGECNFMASTEIYYDNPMVKILERHGFRLWGQPWKSSIHGGLLGLFLRVSNKSGVKTT